MTSAGRAIRHTLLLLLAQVAPLALVCIQPADHLVPLDLTFLIMRRVVERRVFRIGRRWSGVRDAASVDTVNEDPVLEA